MSSSCLASSESSEPLAGTITFIRREYREPTSVHKVNLRTHKTLELLRGTDERPYIRFFRYSPDNNHFVFTMGSVESEQADTELYIGDDRSGQLNRLTDNSIFEGYPAWSADGKRIVFMRGIISASNRFWVIDLESRQEHQVPVAGLQIHRWANWLPDGQRLIAVAKTNIGKSKEQELTGLAEVDLVKGTARWLYKGDVLILTPRFSPDMTRIACIVQPRTPYYNKMGEPERINCVQILDLTTGVMSVVEPGPRALERDLWPVWSPDGKQLAWIRSHGIKRTSKLFISNLEDGTLRRTSFPEEAADGYTLLWSPDGKYLAVLTHRQRKSYALHMVTLKTGKSREMLTSKSQIQLLYWHSSETASIRRSYSKRISG